MDDIKERTCLTAVKATRLTDDKRCGVLSWLPHLRICTNVIRERERERENKSDFIENI